MELLLFFSSLFDTIRHIGLDRRGLREWQKRLCHHDIIYTFEKSTRTSTLSIRAFIIWKLVQSRPLPKMLRRNLLKWAAGFTIERVLFDCCATRLSLKVMRFCNPLNSFLPQLLFLWLWEAAEEGLFDIPFRWGHFRLARLKYPLWLLLNYGTQGWCHSLSSW